MDIIRITLMTFAEKLTARMGLGDELADVLNIVDGELRQEFGGERHYVSKTTEKALIESAAKKAAIRRAWANNEPAEIIAQRHGISRRYVYGVVRGEY